MSDQSSRPPVYLLWNPRWETYQDCAEGGLYAFDDSATAYEERDRLRVHSPGVDVVEMVPADRVSILLEDAAKVRAQRGALLASLEAILVLAEFGAMHAHPSMSRENYRSIRAARRVVEEIGGP